MLNVATRHGQKVHEVGASLGANGFSECALCNRRDCSNCVQVKRFITATSLEYLPACAECAIQSER